MIPVQHKTDGYKLDHISQYVPGTTFVSSNMTPRSNKLARIISHATGGKMVFFGLQYALYKMVKEWNASFFRQPKEDVLAAYSRRVKHYVGPDNGDKAIEAMGRLHDLGYLPVRVKALPEGSRVDMRIPVYVIDNTHPDFGWLVNYVETYLSCNTWPLFNAATLSEQYYLSSKRAAELSGAPAHWLGIANHCFAARGHRGDEDAMISGMAHMLFSIGTDTLWAIDGIEEYYFGDVTYETIGVSVNAFEHATASQRIAYFGSEHESLRDVVTNLYPKGIVSYVGDTQDLFHVADVIMRDLKDEILARQPDSLGLCKFVLRPDSSRKTPKEIILGYRIIDETMYQAVSQPDKDGEFMIVLNNDFDPKEAENSGFNAVEMDGKLYDIEFGIDANGKPDIWANINHPFELVEGRGILQILWEIFGGHVNDKGLRVINDKVGLIYGEGITLELQDDIYRSMVAEGWCVSNVLFGIGSWAFLKDSSRDTYGVAIKATASEVDGAILQMHKKPKTDTGTKHSAKGLLRVERGEEGFVLHQEQTYDQYETGELKTVFENGVMINPHTFSDIRKRLGVNF